MTYGVCRTTFAGVLGLAAGLAVAAPQPLENFARMPQIRDVSISPDGRYVAFISSTNDASVIMTYDRKAGGEFQRVTASETDQFDVNRCEWANNKRLLCSLTGNIRGRRYAETPFARMMAVDADGSNLKALDVAEEKGNMLAARRHRRT